MKIIHQTVVDDHGNPSAALIPWEVFVHIQYMLEDTEISADEAACLREAADDRQADNREAFISLDALKTELSL